MKKGSVILAICATALVGVYAIYSDSLPPRTPGKVARLVSGLSIPRDAKVLEFKDQWNEFNGNGFSLIVLGLEEREFSKVYQDAKLLHFKTMPIKENIYGPLKDISESGIVGLYNIKIDNEASMSFSGTVLNEVNKTIIVYVAVN